MTAPVQAQLERCRDETEAEGRQMKYPYLVVERLHQLYQSLSATGRQTADRVFASWLASENWHLGLVMINDLHIASAIPQLCELAERFRRSTAPGSLQWRETVVQAIHRLRGKSD
jgi:hypothetical protein